MLQSSSSVVRNRPVKTVFRAEKALQGMGTLFRRGTRPMREMVVAHLSEGTSVSSFRYFLRTLHRSGATARADVVILFPGANVPPELTQVIHQEEASFQKMLALTNPKKKSPKSAGMSLKASLIYVDFMAMANPSLLLCSII